MGLMDVDQMSPGSNEGRNGPDRGPSRYFED